MASDLNITAGFDEKTEKRVKTNLQNKDSLDFIIDEAIMAVRDFLTYNTENNIDTLCKFGN